MIFDDDSFFFSMKGSDYRIHFLYMSKDKVINLLRNTDLAEKIWTL